MRHSPRGSRCHVPPLRGQHAIAGRFARSSVRVHVLPRGAPYRVLRRRVRRLRRRPARPRRRGDARRERDRRRRRERATLSRWERRFTPGGVPGVPRPHRGPARSLRSRAHLRRVRAPSIRERVHSRCQNACAHMQRQRAGNDALARVRAEGVACGRCGASNAVPGDGRVVPVRLLQGAHSPRRPRRRQRDRSSAPGARHARVARRGAAPARRGTASS